MRWTKLSSPVGLPPDAPDVYRIADQGAAELIGLGNDDWLAVKPVDELTIDFAVFEFYMGPSIPDDDGVGKLHTILFHGCGPVGSLRECRHIWWGENGYTYYLDFALVEAALRELRRWFDDD